MKFYYGRQHLDKNDFNNILAASKKNKITQGNYTIEFEDVLKKNLNQNIVQWYLMEQQHYF